MHYREYTPSPPLQRFLRCYWTLAGRSSSPQAQRVFPDGSMDIVFHFADSFEQMREDGVWERQSSALLAGQIWNPVTLRPGHYADVFGLRFHPGGLWPFLRFPQQEAAGRILNLNDAWGAPARMLHERLATAPDRVAAAEAFLLALNPSPPPALGSFSARHHRRRFEEAVGIPPKLLARIQRFQQALQKLGSMPIAHAALDCGYYDQAHLIRDFRQFAQTTPSAWLQSQSNVLFLQDSLHAEALL